MDSSQHWGSAPDLVELASRHDVSSVKAALEAGADANGATSDGRTALMEAAKWGHLAMAEVLIAAGAVVDAVDCQGRNALMYAVSAHSKHSPLRRRPPARRVAFMLMAHGASINATDRAGKSVFEYALEGGNSRIVLTLMAKIGIDLNGTVVHGDTPLMRAVMANNDALVEDLLKAGALPTVPNSSGRLPFVTAIKMDHDRVALILSNYDASVFSEISQLNDKQRRDVLVWVARLGRIEAVNAVLDSGVPIDSLSSDGRSALVSAVNSDNTDLVIMLLERGADPNLVVGAGVRTLVYAQNVDVAALLIANGAVVDVGDESGLTPLMGCAYIDDGSQAAELASYLIEQGANLNYADADGITCLMVAAFCGQLELCKRLIAEGAGVNEASEEGQTPLLAAAIRGRTSVAECLIANKANVRVRDRAGRTPLTNAIAASEQADASCALLLLRAGADPDDYDEERDATALGLAARMGSTDLVAALLVKVSDVNVRNREGKTPLIEVASGEGSDLCADAARLAEMLIEYGVEVTAKDNSGMNALDWARQRNHSELVRLLNFEERCSSTDQIARPEKKPLSVVMIAKVIWGEIRRDFQSGTFRGLVSACLMAFFIYIYLPLALFIVAEKLLRWLFS